MELVYDGAMRLYDESIKIQEVIMKMNFSENLRVLREKNGMTQEQLAEKMEVSRQTVSKWESQSSLPEMEKLVTLTELFGCTMDGLLKGNLEKSDQKETQLYEEYGNWMSKTIAAGVGLCIMGAAAECLAEWLFPSMGSTGMFFFLFALAGVVLFIRGGMESGHFRKKHPYVEPFYEEEVLERFHKKYGNVMAGGIAAIVGAVGLMAGASALPAFGSERGEGFLDFLFLTVLAAVSAIVYICLQASKYNVKKYNTDNLWENSEEGKENGRRLGTACGILMTVVTAAYVGLSAITEGWKNLWWMFAVGGLLCGVIYFVLNKRKD